MMRSKFLVQKWNLSQFQFMQKCSVSGTAKGKGKTKTANILKRSNNSFPKQQEPRNRTEFDFTVDQCLTSKSPLTFMKPKEKARQINRNKMGLTIITKNQSQQGKFDSPFEMGTPGMDLITLGLVDSDKIPKYSLTVEDGRMLAKEYSRVLMRKHRARQAAETTMLRLKYEAIESLPEDLKKVALVPDMTPFPVNRFMATLTPPIEGYIDRINEIAANKSAAKEKLR